MAPRPNTGASGSSLDRLSGLGKLLVGFVFVLLVGVLYFVLFYADLDTQISSAEQQHGQLQQDLARAQESKEAYQKDLDEKTRREQLAQQQKKILPDDPEMPTFLQALQNTATVSGVELTSWSPIDEIPQEFFARVPMKLTLKGRFHQIAKFVHSVGQLDRIINVENLQIKKPKQEGEDVIIEVECLATAFRAARPGESPGVNKKRQGGVR